MSKQQSNANVKRDNRVVSQNIKSKTEKRPALLPSSRCQPVNTMCTEASTSYSANAPSAQKIEAKNEYARELFLKHTNIVQIAAKKYPALSERAQLSYAKQLYKVYMLEPKYRIREPLENVRFDTRFHEGSFRMALKVPISNAEDHARYIRNLAISGIKKICFVDMTKKNCVREDWWKLVTELKAQCKTHKINKLTKYLDMYQQKRELEDQNFVSRLKRHSSIKGISLLKDPEVVGHLVREARMPTEKREHPLWLQLTFDTDALNKKYSTGDYSKMQYGLDVDPEETIDYVALEQSKHIETISLSSPPVGRLNPLEQSPITPPRIGPYITVQPEKKLKQALFAPTAPRFCHSNSFMIFLSFVNVQSVRYTNVPTTWPQCNVFQQNPLTVDLNPGCAGIFSVPIRDEQACQLLGLSAGGKGREALLAALEHVGKFRYGSKEPAKEFYRLSMTEKVLHLFFATFPTCPQDGGFVMFFKCKSSLPADGDEVWLERFNCYAHTRQSKRSDEETVAGNTGNTGNMLASMLLPGIERQMKSLRAKLIEENAARSTDI